VWRESSRVFGAPLDPFTIRDTGILWIRGFLGKKNDFSVSKSQNPKILKIQVSV
jgi:hypothetical protein